jgi:ADP-ribose pyrophosphatase YjhB (NUDIX family)
MITEVATLSCNKNSRQHAKDLLLADYRYLTESFWRNEQTGETRLSFFIGIVTLAIGALVNLVTKEDVARSEPLRLIVYASITALLVLGLMTMFRMLMRNENTDRYKQGCDAIRQLFKDHFDGEHVLLQYYPVMPPEKQKKTKLRKFGGLAHMTAAINSLLFAGLVVTVVYPPASPDAGGLLKVYLSGVIAFLFGMTVQLAYMALREKRVKAILYSTIATHAGGVVYRLEHDLVCYLLVRPRDRKDQWVLPKGHIELGEGHGEAALREVHEEAGVVAHIRGLVESVEFTTAKERVNAKFYLMERVFENAPAETRDTGWFPFEEALNLLTHPESQHILKEAEHRRAALNRQH